MRFSGSRAEFIKSTLSRPDVVKPFSVGVPLRVRGGYAQVRNWVHNWAKQACEYKLTPNQAPNPANADERLRTYLHRYLPTVQVSISAEVKQLLERPTWVWQGETHPIYKFFSRFRLGYAAGLQKATEQLQAQHLLAQDSQIIENTRSMSKFIAISSKVPIEFYLKEIKATSSTTTELSTDLAVAKGAKFNSKQFEKDYTHHAIDLGMITALAPNMMNSSAEDVFRYTTLDKETYLALRDKLIKNEIDLHDWVESSKDYTDQNELQQDKAWIATHVQLCMEIAGLENKLQTLASKQETNQARQLSFQKQLDEAQSSLSEVSDQLPSFKGLEESAEAQDLLSREKFLSKSIKALETSWEVCSSIQNKYQREEQATQEALATTELRYKEFCEKVNEWGQARDLPLLTEALTERRALIKQATQNNLFYLGKDRLPALQFQNDAYTLRNNGDLYFEDCLKITDLICQSAIKNGNSHIVMSDFGLGLYVALLSPEEKLKARRLMLKAMCLSAAKYKEQGLEKVTWVIWDQGTNCSTTLQETLGAIASSGSAHPDMVTAELGDLIEIAIQKQLESRPGSVAIVNPGSDRTIGGKYYYDANSLEEQLAVRTLFMFIHSTFNPTLQLRILEQLSPELIRDAILDKQCRMEVFELAPDLKRQVIQVLARAVLNQTCKPADFDDLPHNIKMEVFEVLHKALQSLLAPTSPSASTTARHSFLFRQNSLSSDQTQKFSKAISTYFAQAQFLDDLQKKYGNLARVFVNLRIDFTPQMQRELPKMIARQLVQQLADVINAHLSAYNDIKQSKRALLNTTIKNMNAILETVPVKKETKLHEIIECLEQARKDAAVSDQLFQSRRPRTRTDNLFIDLIMPMADTALRELVQIQTEFLAVEPAQQLDAMC